MGNRGRRRAGTGSVRACARAGGARDHQQPGRAAGRGHDAPAARRSGGAGRQGANPWDVAVESALVEPVAAGDQILFAFWARLDKGTDGAATTTLPYNGVQLSAAPYTALFANPVEIGPEWKLHEVRGRADRAHAAGTLKATIHLATCEQTVDLGPLIVVNLGQ